MFTYTVSFLILLSDHIYVYSQLITCIKDEDCSCPSNNNGEICILDCGDIDRCKSSTLTCRSNDPCEIRCDAKATCSETTINAQTATDVSVFCSGEDSCKSGTEINCGTGHCAVYCSGGSTSCEDMNIIDASNAISFECIGSCPNNAPDPYIAPTSTPSVDPTTSPTRAPTSNPTLNPTLNPSYAHVDASTPTPTDESTAGPSVHATSMTEHPTSSPNDQIATEDATLLPTINPSSAPIQQREGEVSEIESTVESTSTEIPIIVSNNASALSTATLIGAGSCICCILSLICGAVYVRKHRKHMKNTNIDEGIEIHEGIASNARPFGTNNTVFGVNNAVDSDSAPGLQLFDDEEKEGEAPGTTVLSQAISEDEDVLAAVNATAGAVKDECIDGNALNIVNESDDGDILSEVNATAGADIDKGTGMNMEGNIVHDGDECMLDAMDKTTGEWNDNEEFVIEGDSDDENVLTPGNNK